MAENKIFDVFKGKEALEQYLIDYLKETNDQEFIEEIDLLNYAINNGMQKFLSYCVENYPWYFMSNDNNDDYPMINRIAYKGLCDVILQSQKSKFSKSFEKMTDCYGCSYLHTVAELNNGADREKTEEILINAIHSPRASELMGALDKKGKSFLDVASERIFPRFWNEVLKLPNAVEILGEGRRFIDLAETGLEDVCVKAMDLPGIEKVIAKRDSSGRTVLNRMASRFYQEGAKKILLKVLEMSNCLEVLNMGPCFIYESRNKDDGYGEFLQEYLEKIISLPNATEILTTAAGHALINEIAAQKDTDMLLRILDLPNGEKAFNGHINAYHLPEEVYVKLLGSSKIEDGVKLQIIRERLAFDFMDHKGFFKVLELPIIGELAKLKYEGTYGEDVGLLQIISSQSHCRDLAEKILTLPCAEELLAIKINGDKNFVEVFNENARRAKLEELKVPEKLAKAQTKKNDGEGKK